MSMWALNSVYLERSVLVKDFVRIEYDNDSNETTLSQSSKLEHRITSDQTFGKDRQHPPPPHAATQIQSASGTYTCISPIGR